MLTLWEYEPNHYLIIDGNHRVTLFLKHGVDIWMCRVISSECKMTAVDICCMADFCNEKHDGAAVHATYWECLCHIREIMPSYKKGSEYSWNDIACNFVSSWYTISNLKRAGTVINFFSGRDKVLFLLVYNNLVLGIFGRNTHKVWRGISIHICSL